MLVVAKFGRTNESGSMIIADDWIWLHVPKTGGSATERILMANFKKRKDVKFDDLKDKSKPIWHESIAQRQISTPELSVENRTVHANIRRLPTWLLSRIHFEVQRHGARAEVVREHIVQERFKVVHPKRPDGKNDKIVQADAVINKFSPGVSNWIRMENLQEDLEKAFRIEDRGTLVKKRVNDTKQQYIKNPRFWFTMDELQMIYDANPTWARIERMVYGDTLAG